MGWHSLRGPCGQATAWLLSHNVYLVLQGSRWPQPIRTLAMHHKALHLGAGLILSEATEPPGLVLSPPTWPLLAGPNSRGGGISASVDWGCFHVLEEMGP